MIYFKNYKVIKEILIGRCKMKVGDILIPVGIGKKEIQFTNSRLSQRYFKMNLWLFERITKGDK